MNISESEITQSISVIGNNNIVIQNGNNIVIQSNEYRLRIEKASERYEQKLKSILDFINVYKCPIELIGRENEFEDFINWLNSNQKISIRLITGSAGAGKTKFASELLLAYEKQTDWNCGFIPNNELKTFLRKSNPDSWNWDKSLFLVIDYASAHWESLRIFFRLLAGKNKSEIKNKIRILLLERHGNLKSGWFYNIFDRSQSGEVVEELFEPNCIFKFTVLDIKEQKEIIKSTLCKYWDLLAINETKLGSNSLEKFTEDIININKFKTPLEIIMATIVNIKEGVDDNFQYTTNELALKIAQYEIARIEKMTSYDFDNTIIMLHLASFITICQGIKYDYLEEIIENELKTLKLSSTISLSKLKTEFVTIYTQEDIDFYSNNSILQPISPDIIGEAFVKITFKRLWENENDKIKGIFNRAHKIPDTKPFVSLAHLIQDFCTEDWLTKENNNWDNSPLIWLNEMITNNEVDFFLLISIHEAVSDDHLALSQISLETAIATLNILIKVLRKNKIEDEQLKNSIILYIDSLIRTISESGENNLAVKALKYIAKLNIFNKNSRDFYQFNHLLIEASIYHDQGNFKKAAEIANFALKEIECSKDVESIVNIKVSLFTLKSEILRDSRTNFKEAQKCSEMAIEIYEQIEHDDEIEYLEGRAALLVNYSNILAEINYFKESLNNINEAVSIYRKLIDLEKINKYKYIFDLAKNLHNASNRYSDLGINDKACELSEEAVSILTTFYQKMPSIYGEFLAGSTYSLGLHYANLKKFEEAKTTLNRAFNLYNDIAKHYPLRFTLNIIWIINQYGLILFQQENFLEAINIFSIVLKQIKKNKSYLPTFNKEYTDVLVKIAECYFYEKDFKLAIKYAKKASKFGSKLISKGLFFPLAYVDAIDTLGYVYYGNKDYKRAESCFNEAINILITIDEENIYSLELEKIKSHLNDCKNMKLCLDFNNE